MLAAGFLILAALIPPGIVLAVIYGMDKIEREPPSLLVSLFLRGVLAMFPILVLEIIGDSVANVFSWSQLLYLFAAYFIVPGFIEEGVKYVVLIRRAWNEPNFNYTFDAVVYAVFVSLGFAAVENIMYVLDSGFSTAVVRALFSIPGHAMFGVVMGSGVGRARWLEVNGQIERARTVRSHAWITAAVLHGLYDFLLVAFSGVFYIYFACLVIYVIRLLRKSAREDTRIC